MLSDKSAKISIKLFVTTILILTVLLLVHAPVVKADIPDVWYCTYTGTYRVCTELDDYSPESTVFVKGNGFAADTNLQIRVTRPDGSIVNGDGSFTEWVPESNTVTTDEIGEFHYDYVLDGILGMYRVDVLDAEGNVIATHFFTDGQPARVAFSTDAPCSVTVTGGYTNPGDKTGKTFNSATSFSINTEPVTLVTFTYQASVVCSGTTYDFDSASPISPLTSGGSGSSTPVSGHYALSCISTGVSETICNGVDDDCDGSTDEDYTPHSTSCGVGACASTGTTSCVSGTEHNSCTPGTAGTETCNNIDDDCDGTVDESLTRAASNIQGECALNTQTCSAGNWADTASNYIPIAETCDGVDDNCDGTPDDGYVPDNSCFVLSGDCTVGNVASSCSGGVETKCKAYAWTGFFQPVDNLPTLNVVKAGSAIPVKFNLNCNMGLSIFATDPISTKINCVSTASEDTVETTVTAGGSSLNYDPIANQYIYVWKTDKTWAGKCRQLTVTLADGTTHIANFKFK